MYRFNDDEGNMNADFYYVVNLDPTVEDQMVKEFADTARSLHSEVGEGGVSKMIITEYGYHILFDAGAVKNITEDIDTLTYEDLFRTYTNASESKDLFNYFYKKLSLDSNAYNNRSQQLIDDIFTRLKEEDITIKYYESRYADLWK